MVASWRFPLPATHQTRKNPPLLNGRFGSGFSPRCWLAGRRAANDITAYTTTTYGPTLTRRGEQCRAEQSRNTQHKALMRA